MNKLRMKELVKRRRRRAASEVIGSIILMGVTLAVGFAVWAWASNAAVASEKSFGNSINTNTSCLGMTYVGIDANFSSSTSSSVTMWYYNNGNGEINIKSVIVSNSTWIYTYTLSPTVLLYVQNIKAITFSIGTNFAKSALYSFQSTGSNTTTIGSGKSAVTYSCGLVSTSYQQVTPNTTPV